MMDTRVKICGITRVEDASFAVSKGADYIGLIFGESPRQVNTTRAAEIRAAVPDAMIVGVFRDTPLGEVVETAHAVGVNLIQLHGDESPEYCAEVQSRTTTPIIKAFPAHKLPDITILSTYDTTSFFLFDIGKDFVDPEPEATHASLWDEVSRKRSQGFRMFLAGALDESNVRRAIERTNAFCVDVCRGVESAPGIKDHAAVERFIAAVKS